MGVHITPSLYAGGDPPSHSSNVVRTDSAAQAAWLIRSTWAADRPSFTRGVIVWVPDDDEIVRDVLRHLDVDDPWIEDLIQYARTGRVAGAGIS